MADGTFDKDLDMLMKLALLNGILDKDKKAEAIPFAVEVVCTPSNILCRCSGNKKMLEDIEGADEWFEETSNLVKGVMSEQTTKFAKLMEKKFGFTTSEEPLGTGMNFADILSKILSGGGQTIANRKNNLPAIAFSW
ncbi:MAG: hypothetical protein Q4E29_08610 [Lachnospiraceae bacterium]|nr:hypothetical protein [Lachnospiraceae bacterium]